MKMSSIRWFILTEILVLSLVRSVGGPNSFPSLIPLPEGFGPEGVAVGRSTEFFVGSIPTGAIYKGDLRTGVGEILVPAEPGRPILGLKVDRRSSLIFAAGGPSGRGSVFDAGTGDTVVAFEFATAPTFINDVALARDAAYFTDSLRPVLYRVALDAGGTVSASAGFEEIPLTGDFTMVPGFNANGIAATADGSWLIVVNTSLGTLYRVDPSTGDSVLIEVDALLPRGDGLLLDGKTLYVVQNSLNKIAVIELDPALTSGSLAGEIISSDFAVPTTIAEFGNALYAVNARFGLPPGPHHLVRVTKP